MSPPIVLLTDFGLSDAYVGTMKGVILGIQPDARIVDLCHEVPPQEIRAASFLLQGAWSYFPEESVFVCVVDPGVGSDRACLCIGAERRWFLAPDNGLLGFLQEEERIECAFRIENPRYMLPEVSSTFHGRDVFAPAAAHLAGGADAADLGPPIEFIQELPEPKPERRPDHSLLGEVIYVDRFGNLVTNVCREHLQGLVFDAVGTSALEGAGLGIGVDGKAVARLERSYSSVQEGQLVAYMGSTGRLEIAVNRGSAAKTLAASVGSAVRVEVSAVTAAGGSA